MDGDEPVSEEPQWPDFVYNLISSAMRQEDVPEYSQLKKALVSVLQKFGGYEPTVDESYIDHAVRALIYSKNVEAFLDAGTATIDTFSRAADIKLKLWKIAEDAIHKLALTRRERMTNQTQAELTDRLKEAMLRGLKSGDK